LELDLLPHLSATGLLPGVAYDVYVYAYNTGSCATAYNTASPLTATATTSSVGATLLVSPFGDGGFENGSTFAANGWTAVNGTATNKWFVGSVATPFAGANAAYISNDASGATHTYTNTSASTVHFYRDVTFPAGQSLINLSFRWRAQGEGSYDYVTCYVMPISNTPAVNSPAGGLSSWNNFPTAYPGAVIYNSPPNLNLQGATYQTQNICLPGAFAGTTQRLVFAWSNDGSAGTNPPGTIDDITLISAIPASPSTQASGLTLTSVSTTQIDGTFTPAAGAAGHLVVAYPSGSAVTNPSDGINYATGATLGLGKVVYVGAANTFSASGLFGSTTYDFYIYSYSTVACLGNAFNTVSPLSGTETTAACGTLTGTVPVGPTAPASPAGFPSINAAYAYIISNGLGGHTILELQDDYTTAYASVAEGGPIVFNYSGCISATRTLTIRPAATVPGVITISTTSNNATVQFNGGNFITIDGRLGGAGTDKFIRIENTSSTAATAGNAVIFRNDASNNQLLYLDLAASNLNPASNSGTVTLGAIPGVVAFSSTTGLGGNDNNLVSNCNIHSAGSTGNLLNVGVYAFNQAVAGSPACNDNNTISDCNIYDFFHAAAATAAVDILAGNQNWTIANNSVFQTGTRTQTGAFTHRGFWITPGASAVGLSGFNITGNFIGGGAPNCGGAVYTLLGNVATVWQGMDISVGTLSTTNVTNNTIQNLAITTTSTANPYFAGISVASGNVSAGTTAGTGNTIGSATGNGSITLNNSTTSSTASFAHGIRFGSGAVVEANYNTIGGITINNNAISNSFVGISTFGGGTVSTTISNNLIGSLSTPNSIQTTGAGASGTAMGMSGIFISSGSATSNISNNVIANLHSSHTGTASATALTVRGIDVAVGVTTIENNIIRDLSTNSIVAGTANVTAICALAKRTTSAGCTVRGNQIFNLRLNTTSTTTGTQITGLYWAGTTAATDIIEKNFIHSFDVAYATTTSTAATFTGIDVATGTLEIRNNMIRLGINGGGNAVTTPLVIRGISMSSTSAVNVHHNSVHIAGSGVTNASSLSNHSMAYNRAAATGTHIMRNNIFSNTRDNATVGQNNKHYAIRIATTATGLDADYNDYFSLSNTDNLFASSNAVNLPTYTAGWIPGDLNSVTGEPYFIAPDADAATLDLHIDPSVQTVVEQGGAFVASVTDDFDGQVRSGLTPVDIGADAGNFTPLNPCSGTPPVPVAALTNPNPICGSGTKTMNLTGWTNQPGLTYQWQESTTGLVGSFTNVTAGIGANAAAYITPTLTSPMYYQCVVTCTISGDSSVSNSLLAPVNANPTITVTPASGTNVCSGANVDLEASGASTYTWTVNPGVSGYPLVSLLITRNNLSKVTSRPTSTLASGTGAPPATVATPNWVYTVTGTDASGCTSTASVTLSVITTPVVPVQLSYEYAPQPLCTPGVPVTFTVTNGGSIGAGQWVYNWYDATGTTLLQSTTKTDPTDTYTPPTPVADGIAIFETRVSNTLCPASYAKASPNYFVGYTTLKVPTNANCGDNGTLAVYAEGQPDFTPWYENNFSTGLLGAAFDASYGSCNFTGGFCNITNQANSLNGAFLVRNPAAINTNNLQVDFSMSTAPRGFAFNILGADGMAWSYGPDVFQGVLTPGTAGFNAESGSGSGFKLAFDATANGAINSPGAYLMYNCTTPDQGPSSPGVLAFKPGSWWQGLVNAPVSIQISENGFVTVSVNNEIIFDQIPLPAAYLTANKSTWIHSFTARTGGSNQLHRIDDLKIRYNTFEYSVNSTTGNDGSWQTENNFNGLAAGTYPVWVRSLSDPTCFTNTGTIVIGTDPSPTSANTVVADGFLDVVCYGNSTTLKPSISVPGAIYLWEQASSAAGPWTAAIGTNNSEMYITPALIEDTYYRITFTCPSASAVTATSKLITVNAGTITSTNSPQTINCIGDSVTLSAVPGANTTIAWFTTATGGSAIATGNSVTVAPTALPVTYYAEPVTTIYSLKYFNGGQTVIGNTFGTSASGTDIATRFTTTASVIIDSIRVLPSATGVVTVALQNAGSATNISSVNFTITAAMVGNFTNIPVALTVPGSGNYQITTSGVSCAYYSSYAGSYAAGYMSLGGVFTITGGATSPTGASSTSVYGTAFRIAISASCPAGSGARIPVLVEANPSFFISTSVSAASTCVGTIQSIVASSATAYSAYEWTPTTDLYTDAAATIPYTSGVYTATVYVKPSSSGTKNYTVSSAPSGCTNTAVATINALELPNVFATSLPSVACEGTDVQLNASVPTGTYAISSVAFSPEPVPLTPSTVSGDESTETVPLGFTFNYFGNNVTDAIIHTNGYIQLGASTPVCLTCYTPPTAPSAATPNNWAGIWADMSVTAGQVTYATTGTAPNRKFIVNYNNVNFFSVTPASTHQIILNEFDNSVEIHLTSNTGTSLNQRAMGIENAGGTVAYVPAGRNAGTWTATNEAWKFTPLTGTFNYDWSANTTYLNANNIANPVAQNVLIAQTYTVLATDINSGCTQTATTGFTVIPVSTSSTSATACGSYVWNGNTYTASGVYTFTTTGANSCDSIATLNLTINSCNSVVNLKLYIEGYWDGNNGMLPVLANQGEMSSATACDSIDVQLRDASAPYNVVHTIRPVLNQDGSANCVFPAVNGNYYIAVIHRNAVETWSANPIAVGAVPVNYDFSTSANQAYGDNQIQVSVSPAVFALYSGDVVKDFAESIDLIDLDQVEFEISNFSFGYFAEDLNGDGNVDILDTPNLEDNINSFIFSAKP
jgi:hypothetical protein